jgi:6-phosphogluconolactonase
VSVEIEIVDDPARACAALMVGAAAGGGHVVLTGGSTPRTAYGEFAQAVREVDVSLHGTHFWFGDERCVPPEDDRSNFRLARESIFEPLGDRGAIVHRMTGEAGPHDGAAAYAEELADAGEPAFDLLLLGLGPDGHCASLFPGHPGTRVTDRSIIAVHDSPKPPPDRLSLTFPTLDAAAEVWFVTAGDGKADAVAAALSAGPRPTEVPSSAVRGRVATRWLIDRAAAAKLDR